MAVDDDKSLTDKLSDEVTENVIHDDGSSDEVAAQDQALVDDEADIEEDTYPLDEARMEHLDEPRMTPPGNDAEVVRTQTWVQGDERADAESDQREDGGFR